ncbi:MAG: formate dehydrogenase accessory sulfurtransferase FdhD [Thermodesulfobacteriota bacterium]|nr:formate dehydrogenase accessory sulfurtransferase FdhD [Thermodesulfobacteriota bacterium]
MAENKMVEELEITGYSKGSFKKAITKVIKEIPLTIFLNDNEIVTLLCAYGHLKELAIGFLNSEGLIDSMDDIESIHVDDDKGIVEIFTRSRSKLSEKLFMKRVIPSGCGKGSSFYNVMDSLKCKKIDSQLRVSTDQVQSLMKKLHSLSNLYKSTRGVHNSALAIPERILMFREDIGRHNAVDKINGECLLQRIQLDDKILITTGRITSEILIKTGKMGIPVLISRSAATHLAVSMAKEIGITSLGYVRGGSFTVYTHPERIEY